MVADQPALSIVSQDLEESLEDPGILVIHLLLAGKIDVLLLQRKMFFLLCVINKPTAGTVISSVP